MSLLTLPKPDEAILGRRDEIIRQLRKLAPNATLITDQEGRRTFETDALTAYRCMPLAVVLPESTEEVSAILRYCHDNKVKVVPRGAGTSLSGGALPLEDSIVLGITRMTRVLAIDEANRVARVETGITNIAITNAAAVHGFFYAPDPSSQLACTLGGNIATNSGGAHCLKYGVTTNNLLAAPHGDDERRGHRHRRRLSRCSWLRFPRPDRWLGRPVRHRHRGDRAHPQSAGRRTADAARLRLLGSRRRLRRRHHRRRHRAGRHRVHGQAGDPGLREFRRRRLPARRRGAAHRRGRRLA